MKALAQNPESLKLMLEVGAIGAAGILAYMFIKGEGAGGLIADVFEGIGGAAKELYYDADPDNKLGIFGTDLANYSYGRGVGKPVSLETCPSGYTTFPLTCTKGWTTVGRLDHGGKCDIGYEKDAGLCYKKCAKGFHGVGPVCWRNSFHNSSKDVPKEDRVTTETRRHFKDA